MLTEDEDVGNGALLGHLEEHGLDVRPVAGQVQLHRANCLIELRKQGLHLLAEWAITLGEIGLLGFWSMMIFLAVLTIGFIYEWKKGALEWE